MIPGNFMFSIFPVIFIIVFIIIIGTIVVNLGKGMAEWGRNNKSPVLGVAATVVSKRTHVASYNTASGMNDDMHHYHHSSSTYYATFEVESGDRMEFHIPSSEYGLLAEGDRGKLTFQGTRYLSFDREKTN